MSDKDEASTAPFLNRAQFVASGQHRGKRWEDMADKDLRAIDISGHPDQRRAQREMARRAPRPLQMKMTSHAINAGSQLVWDRWNADEGGIYTFLMALANEALAANRKDELGRYEHDGLAFEIVDDSDTSYLLEDMSKIIQKEADDATDERKA